MSLTVEVCQDMVNIIASDPLSGYVDELLTIEELDEFISELQKAKWQAVLYASKD